MQINSLNFINNTSIIAAKSVLTVSNPLSFNGYMPGTEDVSDTFILRKKSAKRAVDFVPNFLLGKDKVIENTLKFHDFTQYGKKGIPLRYSRSSFISDINEVLKDVPEDEQEKLLATFNLKKGTNDIDGIAKIIYDSRHKISKSFEEKIDKNSPSEKLKNLIKKFYSQNECTSINPEIKKTFDTILSGLPEFLMIIGKIQHNTHIYSVDIHSLEVLQKSMNNPLYNELSPDSKVVLKMTALLHDFGKKGNVITKGHAAQSKEDAISILDKFALSENIKERIIKQIEHHHWFEKYNKHEYSPEKVAEIFGNEEDLKIAKILAKSDLESIGDDFHLYILNPWNYMTQEEFDEEFARKVDLIKPKAIKLDYHAFKNDMMAQRDGFLVSVASDPDTPFNLLNDIKSGIYIPNDYIREIINNSKGKMTEVLGDYDKKMQIVLDSVLQKSQIPSDVILYRGSSPLDFGLYDIDAKEFLDKFFQEGKTFVIPIYLHTSINPIVADSFAKSSNCKRGILYKFNTPKGTNGIFMEGISPNTFQDEKEILLPRNLICEFKKRTTLPDCEIVEVDILKEKPTMKKIHKFWEEADDDYWSKTTLRPMLPKAC